MSALLGCPFCGGDAQTDFIEGESYIIECYVCRAETGIKDSEAEAIAAWNRRAPASPAVATDAPSIPGAGAEGMPELPKAANQQLMGDWFSAGQMHEYGTHSYTRGRLQAIEDYKDALAQRAPDAAMLLEVIRTVRNHPEFDDEEAPFTIMLDEALAGKRPALLGAIDSWANGVMHTAEEVTGGRMASVGSFLDSPEGKQALKALRATSPAPKVSTQPDRSRPSGNAGEGVARYKLSEAEKAALVEAAKTSALVAEMDGGGIMFINRGEQPGDYDFPTCPTCHGSGHADDAAEHTNPESRLDEAKAGNLQWRNGHNDRMAEHAKRAKPDDERALFDAWLTAEMPMRSLMLVSGTASDDFKSEVLHLYTGWRAGRAALQQQAGVPEGWQVVPKEPTEAMVHAAEDVPTPRPFGKVYRAMIAAAPTLGGARDD